MSRRASNRPSGSPHHSKSVILYLRGPTHAMALDQNFLVFIVPAIIALLAATFALPSKRRIEKDPSTAYKGGRRALVNIAVVFALVMGLILAGLGGTLEVEPIVGEVTMVHVGGVSLIVMAVVLLVASSRVRKLLRSARRGEREEVLEATVVSGQRPVSQGTPGPMPPPRPQVPYRPPPREGGAPPPLPPRVRREPPPREEYQWGGAPPPRGPPRRGPPPG